MEERTAPYGYGERGAGGKFRKPPPRKPPSKPYDRPPPPPLAAVTKPQSWLSKLVDPAKNLLGGASRILPSFFHLSDNRDDDEEVVPPNRDDGRCNSNQAVITSFDGPHSNDVPESSNRYSEPVEHGTVEQIHSSDKTEISKIEHLIEGKAFSRDEIDRLIEILNSRTLDVHEAEWGTREIVTAAAVERESPLLTHQGRQEDNNRAIVGTPLPQLKVREEIGASPIDIAKAFMGSRNLDPCATPHSASAKAEDKLQLIESATKPLIRSPIPMSSPHWPGVMVADQRGYASPVSHRDRYGLHDFPRTPYSRTFYSNSRSKQLADSGYPGSSSNFFQKSRVPIYGQAKRSGDALQDHHGSVGPIRRMRNKFSSESRSRGSIFSKHLVEVPSGSKVLPGEKNLGPNETRNHSKHLPVGGGSSGSEEASSFLNPSTSQAVKRILEHLDRNKPTPKEKAAELERATAWRKSAAAVSFDDLGKETASLSHDNKADLVSKGNDGNITSDVPVKFPEVAIKETNIAAPGRVLTSNLDGVSSMRNPGGSFPSHFDNISGSTAHTSPEQVNNGKGNILQKETSKHQTDNGVQNHSSELSKRPVANVASSKPTLSSIAISKPDPRRMVSSGNGIGFTFPVSASFGVMSEPPTPSIMPTSSATVVSSLQTPASTVPSYSFGSKRTSPPLVFSFPGGGIPSDDTSDLKFDFGSDGNSRLSFKSIGKGAMCS